jgi:hypothetical protein
MFLPFLAPKVLFIYIFTIVKSMVNVQHHAIRPEFSRLGMGTRAYLSKFCGIYCGMYTEEGFVFTWLSSYIWANGSTLGNVATPLTKQDGGDINVDNTRSQWALSSFLHDI